MASAGSRRAAVLVPGGAYTVDGPLLMYAGLAVQRREGYAHRISWTPPKSLATSHAVGPRASLGGSVTVTVAVRRQWLCLNLGHAACRAISPQGMLVLGADWIGLGPDSDPGGWDDRDEIIHQNRR